MRPVPVVLRRIAFWPHWSASPERNRGGGGQEPADRRRHVNRGSGGGREGGQAVESRRRGAC